MLCFSALRAMDSFNTQNVWNLHKYHTSLSTTLLAKMCGTYGGFTVIYCYFGNFVFTTVKSVYSQVKGPRPELDYREYLTIHDQQSKNLRTIPVGTWHMGLDYRQLWATE